MTKGNRRQRRNLSKLKRDIMALDNIDDLWETHITCGDRMAAFDPDTYGDKFGNVVVAIADQISAKYERTELDWQRDLNVTLFRCVLHYALVIEHILATMNYRAAPNWLDDLLKYRTELEAAYHAIENDVFQFYDRQASNRARKGMTITKRDFQQAILEHVTPAFSDFQDAMRDAIEGDDGAALQILAAKWPGAARYVEIFESTLDIGDDTKTARETVYIGQRLLDYERIGISDTRRAWKKMYIELQIKARQDIESLDPDELAAWHFFASETPHKMRPNQLNDFEGRLRQMKTRVKKLK